MIKHTPAMTAHIHQAKMIAKTLGMRRAAGYLRNRGWSIEGALWALLRLEVRV